MSLRILMIFLSLALTTCASRTEKLDEAIVYNGPQFQLKLVRYRGQSSKGEVYNVQCSSPQTAASPANTMQDAGWVALGNGSAVGYINAGQLVERQRWNYLTVDEQTLVWAGTGFNISFDACGHFRSWYPTALPAELIIPAEKPDNCRPNGSADCRLYDFQGDREPSYTQIQVDPKAGQISFVVQSRAFKNPNGFKVQSADSGQTWQVENL